jgi:hypothetical protein
VAGKNAMTKIKTFALLGSAATLAALTVRRPMGVVL